MIKLMKSAVGYARTSGHMNPKASIPNQCRLIKEYCENNNIFLKEIYMDDSKSATTVEGRAGYMKLKSDLDQVDTDMVVVTFFDRLAREAFEFVLTVIDLDKRGIEIVSISEDLSSKKMSPIHLAMIAFEIEHENKQRTERIHGAIKENRRKGIFNLPHVPDGYIKDKESRLVIDHIRGQQVKEIFEVFIHTKCIYETLSRFENMCEKKITTILENKTYTGYIYKKDKTLNNPLSYTQSSFVEHPAIIDVATFEKAQCIIEQSRKPSTRNHKRYLLRSIIKCPQCSVVMNTNNGMYFCRKCKVNKIQILQEDIEGKFLLWIKDISFENEIEKNNTPQLCLEIKELEKRKKKLEMNYSIAKISLTKFQEETHSLNNQIKKYQEDKSGLNNSSHLKYELKDLIRNKSWGKLNKRLFEEKIFVTLDETHNNIKLIKNG